jgi:hypothetical protein
MLAYITGSVDQELLLQNEYLVTENRILKSQIKGRLRLTDPERISLAELGQRLGRKALEEVAQIVRPETILGWHRKLIAMKFNGSQSRSSVGRAPNGPSHRGFGAPVCPGESQLGVSADRGRFEQPWTRNQPPDGG